MKSYIRILLLAVPELLNKFTSFVAIFLLSKSLNPEDMGVYAQYTALVGLLIPVVTMNLGGGMTRFHILRGFNYLQGIVKNHVFFFLCIIAFSVIIGLAININFLFISLPVLIILGDYFKGLAIYNKNDGLLILLSFISAVALILFYMSASMFKNDLWTFVVYLAFISPFVVSIFGYALISIKGLYVDGKAARLDKELVRYSLPTIPRSYAGRLMNSFDKIIGVFIFGEVFMGMFTVNYGLAFSGIAIVEIFTRFYYPIYLENRKYLSVALVVKKNLKYIFGFSLLIMSIYPLLKWVFPLIIDVNYEMSENFILLWLANIVFLLFRSLDVEFMFNGHSKYSLYSYIIGVTTNLLVLLISAICESQFLFYASTLVGYVAMVITCYSFLRHVELG